LTEQLSLLGARDGMLLVASAAPAFLDRYAVRQGGSITRFEPSGVAPDAMLRGLNLLRHADAGMVVPWTVGDASSEVSLTPNINRAWIVGDTSPWLLAAAPTAGPVTLTYEDPVLGPELPVQPGVTYEASGRFACHQAEARLRLVALDGHGRAVAAKTVALSNQHRGGTRLADYQDAAVRLRMPADAVAVRYELELVGHVVEPTAVTARSLVFLLEWALVPAPAHVSDWTPDPAGIPLLVQAAAGLGRAQVFQAPVELGRRTGADHADVIDLAADGSEPVAVFRPSLPEGVTAAIDHFAANAVRLSVTGTSAPVSLYVDGVLAGRTPAVGPARAAATRHPKVVVAEKFCDGNPHVLEVRDTTGTVVLARDAKVLPTALTPWLALQRYSGHPLPYQLAPLARHRYQALREHLQQLDDRVSAGTADTDDLARLAQLSRVHHVLETGFEKNRDFGPLHFPEVDDPQVSVVIPVHNKFSVTYHCLASLVLARNDASFEVIVVDDGSSDETLELADIAPNVVVCRNDDAQGFVGACNLGASQARGEYVVLLNNDTETTPGWLDELIGAFDRFDDVGLAGSRLLYPDGRLQDAGGIVWSSGNPWNYGRGQNPADPRFSYARQADYLSGAALMVPRQVWEKVDGLSKEYAPAYFEDTDLSFKVRDAGYTTWFVPSSEVYHFEGISNGTDVNTTSGLKRFQEVNRPKFRQKWAQAVEHNGQEGQGPDLVKDRGILGRALFIDHAAPRPDRDAGSFAAVQEMRLVQSLGYKVTFAPLNSAYLGHYTHDLNRLGIETIHSPFALSVEAFLEARGGEFDVVYITRYNVADQVLPAIRRHAPQAKVLFCNADLHFLREMRTAQRTGDEESWAKAISVRDAELEVMRDVDVVLSYNQVEHAVIQSHNLGATKVTTCPWVVESVDHDTVPPFAGREGIAFLGGYGHPPNVEAVDFFVENVLPKLRGRVPDLKFNIYGSEMPERLHRLADDVVNPVGFVDTVDEVYHHNRVFVAPLLTGAGIKGKVLGALAHGIPSILSPVAAESTGVREGLDCLIASDVEEWVEAVASLYADEENWTRMSRSALEFTTRNYSFERGRELMRTAFHEAGVYRTRD
jgi:GT2 family glycosyltransferase